MSAAPFVIINFYKFVNKKNQVVSFSLLPIQWTTDKPLHSLPQEETFFLDGLTTVQRCCEQFHKQVTAWRVLLREEDDYPQVLVLTKDNHWVQLLHPCKPYERAGRTILITLHFLHHVKKNPHTSADALIWEQLHKIFRKRRIYSFCNARPRERDLLDHLPFIREALNQDDTLSKSQFLAKILENLERMTDTSWEDDLEDTTCHESDDIPEGTLWEMVEERSMSITRNEETMSVIEVIEAFTSLADEAATPAQKIHIMMGTVSSQLKTNPTCNSHMPTEVWRNCIQNLSTIVHILQQHPNILMNTDHDLRVEFKETKRRSDYDGEILLYGNLYRRVERVYIEYFWGLASLPRNKEYIKGLQNEPILILLCKDAFSYFKWKNDVRNAAKVALLLMQLLYSKSAEEYAILLTTTEQKNEGKNELNFPKTCSLLLEEMASFICDHGELDSKVRSTLCQVYHHAIMDNYLKCKTLMLRSNLLEKSEMEILTRVLYNRVIVQLGFCAFRAGFITEAHNFLSELYTTGRTKELIGQAVSGWHHGDDIPKQQENLERRLQTPYHLQVNMALLDSVYIICGMILEIPNMETTQHRETKVINGTIREWMELKQMRVQGFPSELVHDQLVAATRALSRAEFDVCMDNIRGLHVWDLVVNKDHVLEMLETKVKEASLRVFVWKYWLYCDSWSLDMLASRFRLPKAQIRTILFDMLTQELPGTWREREGRILLRHENCRTSVARFINKVAVFAEYNEKKAKCE